MSHVTGKHVLKSLLFSYMKKDWQAGSRQSFFGYDTDYKIVLCCIHRLYSVVVVLQNEGLVGPARRWAINQLS